MDRFSLAAVAGGNTPLVCPIKTTHGRPLTVEQRTINTLHAATRAMAERGNALLKTAFTALRRVSLCPWRIGAITAAALVLLHTSTTAPRDQNRYWETLSCRRAETGDRTRKWAVELQKRVIADRQACVQEPASSQVKRCCPW